MSNKRATQEFQELLPFSFKMRDWCANYKRFVFLLIPFFLLSLFVIFKVSLRNPQTERDFLLAKNTYIQWERNVGLDSSHLQTLRALLKKHPELVVPYETLIIQKLLALGKTEEVQSLAENTLKRTSLHGSTYYTQFARNTLLIEDQGSGVERLQQAFKRSLELKEEMLSDEQFWQAQKGAHFGSMLFAFNLLRIAFLAETLGITDEELLAWRELKRYAKWDNISNEKGMPNVDGQAFALLSRHFTEGNLSLQDYIKYRENTIFSMEKSG